MSQFFQGVTAGSLPPSVPTSFETQDGTAVPAANILIVNGIDSTENNDNGIITKGGVVGTGTSNELDVVITNRATGATTTTGAATSTAITLPLGATPGVYTFDIRVSGFANSGTGSPLGCGFTIVGSIRTTGAAATLMANQAVDHFEEAALIGVTAVLAVSGNNALVNVTGISDGGVGFGINWNATLNYTLAT